MDGAEDTDKAVAAVASGAVVSVEGLTDEEVVQFGELVASAREAHLADKRLLGMLKRDEERSGSSDPCERGSEVQEATHALYGSRACVCAIGALLCVLRGGRWRYALKNRGISWADITKARMNPVFASAYNAVRAGTADRLSLKAADSLDAILDGEEVSPQAARTAQFVLERTDGAFAPPDRNVHITGDPPPQVVYNINLGALPCGNRAVKPLPSAATPESAPIDV